MSDHLSQKELASYLWGAATLLRDDPDGQPAASPAKLNHLHRTQRKVPPR